MSKRATRKGESRNQELDARRKSVKRILGAGGVAAGGQLVGGGWTKPLVSSVILPAHAQTSPGQEVSVDSIDDPCIITLTCTGFQTFSVQIDGSVEPAIKNVTVDVQLGTDGGGKSPLPAVLTDANGDYRAMTPLSGAIHSVQVSVTLPDFPKAGTATCSIDTYSTSGLVDGGGYHTAYGANYFCSATSP